MADGVFTKNSRGGAQMSARICPRSSAIRCSPARDVISRTRLFGSTSTIADRPDVDPGARRGVGRDRPAPTGSRDGASIRVPATDGAPASDCTVHPDDRIADANQAAPATRTSDAAAVSDLQRRGGEAAPRRRAGRQQERRVLVAIRLEQRLEADDLRIGLAGAVPQVVVVRRARRVVRHRFSFSRSIFMPRCRFTRTEPGVRPVRSAISGPGQSFHEPQDQRLAIRVGQRADRGQRDVGVRLAGRGARRLEIVGKLHEVRGPPVEVGRAVARDHRDPSAEGRRVAQIVEPPPRRQEHVLDEVLDLVAADTGEQQSVDHAAVSLVQAA